MNPIKYCVSVVALVGLCLSTGCGPEPVVGEVSGTITFDGKPIEKGSISFTPANGQGPSGGGEIVGGKYKCDGALGECKVEIRSPKVVGKKKLYDTPDSPVQEVFEEVLPQKFNEATELRFDVKKGKNEKNWDLTSK